jgi:hypothetical protein
LKTSSPMSAIAARNSFSAISGDQLTIPSPLAIRIAPASGASGTCSHEP